MTLLSDSLETGITVAIDADGARSLATETRVDQVARHLRAAIVNGRLKPGDRIRQEAIAAELGTSRIPVREALRQLESEGLISLIPYSGARVARVDAEEYEEIYLMREHLEPLAIRESLPRLTARHFSEIHDLVAQIERTEDPTDVLDLDRRFHLLTYSAAARPRLLQMIEGFWNSTQQYRRVFYRLAGDRLISHSGNVSLTHMEHRLLVDALERRDADTADNIVRVHIRRTRLTLARYREVFD
ncbi:MAG: GntR family transcriptional regulator [Thermomicrobiales bacterium]|nr:GntR family transcriptional regulator [Thermomicrobiales bacterium]